MKVLALSLLFATSVFALPDSPVPKPIEANPVVHQFWDRTNRIESATMIGVGAFDLAQTCHGIANGGQERWMPMKSCGQLVGSGVAIGLGVELLSYELHKHGHHKLERIPVLALISGNVAGISYSKAHGMF